MDPDVLIAGPMDIFIAPTGEALPEKDALAPPLMEITPGGNWVKVDFMGEEAGLDVTEELDFKYVNESDLAVAAAKTKEEVKIAFKCADKSIDTMAKFSHALTVKTPIAAGAAQTGQTVVGIGDGALKEFALLAIVKNPEGGDCVIHLHKVVLSSGIGMKHAKKFADWDAEFTALADLTQAVGERAGAIYSITAQAAS